MEMVAEWLQHRGKTRRAASMRIIAAPAPVYLIGVPPLIDAGSIRPASVQSVLGQLALALKMAAISASDISSGCFLVCSLRSIHNPASLACAVVAVTMAAG